MQDRRLLVVWAAGFVDGEGTIALTRRAGHTFGCLRLEVGQRDPEPLRILMSLWGGRMYCRPAKGRAAALHVWIIQARSAARAIAEMGPYFVVKREHARIAIAYQQLVGKSGQGADRSLYAQRGAHEEALRGLNAKGPSYRVRSEVPAAFTDAFTEILARDQ